MSMYIGVLFIHAIAVLVLTAGLTVEAWMLFLLRRAFSLGEARSWTAPLPWLTAASISSLIVVYLTGAYLTESLKAWEFSWPRLAVLGIVLFAVFGALTGRRLRAIRRLCNGVRDNESELQGYLRNPWLKTSLTVRIWIVMGTVLLTAAKPGFFESLSIVAASLVLGGITSLVTFGRNGTIATIGQSSR